MDTVENCDSYINICHEPIHQIIVCSLLPFLQDIVQCCHLFRVETHTSWYVCVTLIVLL
jgi:hypothetical protein